MPDFLEEFLKNLTSSQKEELLDWLDEDDSGDYAVDLIKEHCKED